MGREYRHLHRRIVALEQGGQLWWELEELVSDSVGGVDEWDARVLLAGHWRRPLLACLGPRSVGTG